MLTFKLVDNDTTLHGVHTDTVAFNPTVLIKCSMCSCPVTDAHSARVAQENDPRQIVTFYHHFCFVLFCFSILVARLRRAELYRCSRETETGSDTRREEGNAQ